MMLQRTDDINTDLAWTQFIRTQLHINDIKVVHDDDTLSITICDDDFSAIPEDMQDLLNAEGTRIPLEDNETRFIVSKMIFAPQDIDITFRTYKVKKNEKVQLKIVPFVSAPSIGGKNTYIFIIGEDNSQSWLKELKHELTQYIDKLRSIDPDGSVMFVRYHRSPQNPSSVGLTEEKLHIREKQKINAFIKTLKSIQAPMGDSSAISSGIVEQYTKSNIHTATTSLFLINSPNAMDFFKKKAKLYKKTAARKTNLDLNLQFTLDYEDDSPLYKVETSHKFMLFHSGNPQQFGTITMPLKKNATLRLQGQGKEIVINTELVPWADDVDHACEILMKAYKVTLNEKETTYTRLRKLEDLHKMLPDMIPDSIIKTMNWLRETLELVQYDEKNYQAFLYGIKLDLGNLVESMRVTTEPVSVQDTSAASMLQPPHRLIYHGLKSVWNHMLGQAQHLDQPSQQPRLLDSAHEKPQARMSHAHLQHAFNRRHNHIVVKRRLNHSYHAEEPRFPVLSAARGQNEHVLAWSSIIPIALMAIGFCALYLAYQEWCRRAERVKKNSRKLFSAEGTTSLDNRVSHTNTLKPM